MTTTVKVAVVGSGLAGLTASYLLQKPTREITGKDEKNIEVHLFEKVNHGEFGWAISISDHECARPPR
jgi:protoporphyrinogen oxidase